MDIEVYKTPNNLQIILSCLFLLVASLRAVNFGFWSHLGCSGQNPIIFSREGLV